jgi:hypothetical protein
MPSLDLSSNSCAVFKGPTHRDGHDACEAERMNPSNSSPRRTVSIQRLSVRTFGWLSFLRKSAVLEDRQPKRPSLARIPKQLPLSWTKHRPPLGCFRGIAMIERHSAAYPPQ